MVTSRGTATWPDPITRYLDRAVSEIHAAALVGVEALGIPWSKTQPARVGRGRPDADELA